MSWKNQLDTASFGGATFQCQKLGDGVVRHLATFKYPYKDGADLEDMGREPRTTKLSAVFFGPEYMTDLGELMLVVDAGRAMTFKHPLLGTWKARASLSSIDHTWDFRDGCMVEITVIEDGTNTELPTLFSVAALKDKVTLEQAALALWLADLPTTVDGSPEIVDQFAEVDDLLTDFVADVESELAFHVDQAMNELRNAVADGIDLCREYFPRENDIWNVIKGSHAVLESCRQLAARAMSDLPAWEQYTLLVDTPLPLIAFSKYGDAAESLALEAMNKIRNPNKIDAGTVLTIFAKAKSAAGLDEL